MSRDSFGFYSLPFNPNLKKRARALRKAGSLPESLVWLELKNKKLQGLDFDRQKIIGDYIVDFFCSEKRLVIEIDDKATHDFKVDYDRKRDTYLESLGLTVMHIAAKDVLANLSVVIEWLAGRVAVLSAADSLPPRP